MAIDLGLGLVNRLAFACFVKERKTWVLIQRNINAVDMDLDAHDGCALNVRRCWARVHAHRRQNVWRLQPTAFEFRVGSGVLSGLKNGSRGEEI